MKIFLLFLLCFVTFLLPVDAKAYFQPKPVIFYGDSQIGQSEKGNLVYQQIVAGILNKNPGEVFHTGDLVNYKDDLLAWTTFDFITAPLKLSSKFYPAIGNHDAYTGYFSSRFLLPKGGRYYTVVYSRMYFIVLDSNSDFNRDLYQYNWFKSRLSRAKSLKKTIVVIFHHPPIASGGGVENTQKLLPLFQKYRVRIVFNGHYHSYERSYYKGTYYIITGGGGATLYPPEGPINPYMRKYLKSYNFCQLELLEKNMLLNVYDQDLNTIDVRSIMY